MSDILSADGAKSVVAEALMKALGEEQRNALIQKAIENLMTPAKLSYGGSGSTPLEDAFRDGVVEIARQIINDKLSNDEDFKFKLKGIISDSVEVFLVTKREETVSALACSLHQSVTFDRNRC